MTLNLVKKEKTKGSNRVKFKRAGWNDDFLLKLLAQNSNAIALKENTDVRHRVGGGITPAVLPHHRTYGSVYGGS